MSAPADALLHDFYHIGYSKRPQNSWGEQDTPPEAAVSIKSYGHAVT